MKQYLEVVLYSGCILFVNDSLKSIFHSANRLDRALARTNCPVQSSYCQDGTSWRLATFATGRDKIDRDRISQTVTSEAGVPDNDIPAPCSWGSTFVRSLA